MGVSYQQQRWLLLAGAGQREPSWLLFSWCGMGAVIVRVASPKGPWLIQMNDLGKHHRSEVVHPFHSGAADRSLYRPDPIRRCRLQIPTNRGSHRPLCPDLASGFAL